MMVEVYEADRRWTIHMRLIDDGGEYMRREDDGRYI